MKKLSIVLFVSGFAFAVPSFASEESVAVANVISIAAHQNQDSSDESVAQVYQHVHFQLDRFYAIAHQNPNDRASLHQILVWGQSETANQILGLKLKIRAMQKAESNYFTAGVTNWAADKSVDSLNSLQLTIKNHLNTTANLVNKKGGDAASQYLQDHVTGVESIIREMTALIF
jgi:hypothetical protein